jgi:hypothetical protein
MAYPIRSKLLAQALLASALAAQAGRAAAAPAPAPACDGSRAVEVVKAEAARQALDLSSLQLVVEGPYTRAKFLRTHHAFPPGPAVKQRLARRTFWFVWFHPPFRGSIGARGTDLWALVDSARCDLLHVERGR